MSIIIEPHRDLVTTACAVTASPADQRSRPIELSILMPCLNESRTVGACIRQAQAFLARSGMSGEVLIADNGSTDGSQALALALGARVVSVPVRGYGAALIAGITAARGRYVVMGDSDESYDFSALDPYVQALRAGDQLVMGNRFLGGIRPGAMPLLHRYLGNPVLSFLGRLFFRVDIGDFHCGLRGFDRAAILSLGLRCEGMEFASEMVVKASLRGLRIAEVPTTLFPDGRDRPPHLRSWRDGWRHLRFLLLFSPRWLFLYPGLLLTALGLAGMAWLLPSAQPLGPVILDVHTMLYAGGATLTGVQLMMFALFAKVFAVEHGILPDNRLLAGLRRHASVELGVAVGVLLMLAGVGVSVHSVITWGSAQFGALDPRVGMRIVIPALTLFVTGIQLLFASMFFGVLGLRMHGRHQAPAP